MAMVGKSLVNYPCHSESDWFSPDDVHGRVIHRIFGLNNVGNHQLLRTVRVTYLPSVSSTNLVIEVDFCSLIHTQDHKHIFFSWQKEITTYHDKSHAKAPTSYFRHLLVIKPTSYFQPYCWWKRSCTSWYGKYPIIYRYYRVLYIHPRWCGSSEPSPVVTWVEVAWVIWPWSL